MNPDVEEAKRYARRAECAAEQCSSWVLCRDDFDFDSVSFQYACEHCGRAAGVHSLERGVGDQLESVTALANQVILANALIGQRLCTPQCLLGDPYERAECTCRCGERWHGRLWSCHWRTTWPG